jgi:monoamine oxidase
MSSETLAGGSVDVAIIGAGAAGVGAARRLQALRPDLSLVLLEASGRIGGRARTVHPADLGGFALDLGCGWLHGAKTNAWTGIAEEIGLTVDRTPAPWSEGGQQLQRDDNDAKAARIASNEFFERIYAYDGEEDAALSALLRSDNSWNGYIQALGAFLTGAELDRSSVIDQSRYDPGQGPDWRVRQGYGTLVATYAAPVTVHTGAEVRRIDHSAVDHVSLSTVKGDLRAKAVIIAVSTNILAAERITFWPPLPDKVEAASQLPLGLANKLFLQLRTPEAFPADAHILGSYHSGRTAGYQLRPFGAPVIEAYFAGDLAHDLEREGIGAAFDFSVEQLKRFFGSGIEGMLSPAVMSTWASEPFVGGSYSYAVPGASDLRQVLAAPHDQRLFFAGEACSRMRYSTAHGAYETGSAAAEAVVKTLA